MFFYAENIQEAVRQTQENSDTEIRRLKNIVTRLELEVHELRSSSDRDNPNVFSAVTKTLARKVGNLTNPHILNSQTPAPVPLVTTASTESAGDDYLEQSMKRAQEDVEVLRSLVFQTIILVLLLLPYITHTIVGTSIRRRNQGFER
jgi:hypothetical protein